MKIIRGDANQGSISPLDTEAIDEGLRLDRVIYHKLSSLTDNKVLVEPTGKDSEYDRFLIHMNEIHAWYVYGIGEKPDVDVDNLDEYLGLTPDHPQSYHYFMWENFFKHINIKPENVHIPTGNLEYALEFCEWYEKRIKEVGGIDLQVMGIGRDGHIGFNEPGSSLGSRTRIKTLAPETVEDNSRFFKSKDEVPRYAVTMGVGTIMEARECLLLASGKGKAEAVKACIEGPVTSEITASPSNFIPGPLSL